MTREKHKKEIVFPVRVRTRLGIRQVYTRRTTRKRAVKNVKNVPVRFNAPWKAASF